MTRQLGLLLLLSVAACATTTPESVEKPLETPYIVWPEAPETPRIEYISQFSSAEDLNLRESFSHKMKEFLAGSDDRRMSRPYAIAVNNDIIAVADPGAALVHLFDRGRKIYRELRGIEDHVFVSPIGVALSGDKLYVADSVLNKVFILNHRSKLLSIVDDLQRPTSLAFDPVGKRLYVADTLAHNIKVFDQGGEPLFVIGERGEQDIQFNFPSHLVFADQHLYVNDTMNFRIQIYDAQGGHLKTFGKHGTSSGSFTQPKGVAVDSEGHIYVADALSDRVQIFDQNGTFLLGFGNKGTGPGTFYMPTGLAIWKDMIYVTDSYNQRVQVFRYLREEP